MFNSSRGFRHQKFTGSARFDVNKQLLVSDAYFLSAANIWVFLGAGCSEMLWPFRQMRVSKLPMIPNT